MEETKETKGLSIASMVLGIISIVLFCVYYISLPCAILAVIFGMIGKNRGERGMAIAGLVLGIIALGLDVLAIAGIAGVVHSII